MFVFLLCHFSYFHSHLLISQIRFLYVCLTSPISLWMRRLNSLPSKHRKSSPGCKMPHLMAIARAVLILSPVTMRTVIPARWHFLMASGTYGAKEKKKHASSTWAWLEHWKNKKFEQRKILTDSQLVFAIIIVLQTMKCCWQNTGPMVSTEFLNYCSQWSSLSDICTLAQRCQTIGQNLPSKRPKPDHWMALEILREGRFGTFNHIFIGFTVFCSDKDIHNSYSYYTKVIN